MAPAASSTPTFSSAHALLSTFQFERVLSEGELLSRSVSAAPLGPAGALSRGSAADRDAMNRPADSAGVHPWHGGARIGNGTGAMHPQAGKDAVRTRRGTGPDIVRRVEQDRDRTSARTYWRREQKQLTRCEGQVTANDIYSTSLAWFAAGRSAPDVQISSICPATDKVKMPLMPWEPGRYADR